MLTLRAGRIPAIYDPNHDHSVFETAAILLWLEKKYDPEHKFSWGSDEPNGEKLRSQALQWICERKGREEVVRRLMCALCQSGCTAVSA